MDALTESDVATMGSSELKSTSRDIEVTADDLIDAFPAHEHHMTVKAKLRALAQKGAIDQDEVAEIHARWMDSR